MTRFRENKMAAQNFKKSFITEAVKLSSPNLVSTYPLWSYVMGPNLKSIGPEMDFWRIFQHPSEKVVLAKRGARDLGNRK